jgi:UDP-N-acetylmuramate--alanine ligase
MNSKNIGPGTHVHFIGIGGSGLSAIARMLKGQGYTVTGSDQAMTTFAADLQRDGIPVVVGHDSRNVQGADWVVRSSAVPDDNAEVQAAKRAGVPVYRRADFLGKFMEDKTGIAVAGTHGKTTTTAMIAFVLSRMGLAPSFIVGGVLNDLGVNARAGAGNLFVVEADEYDRMFLGLKPQIEVVTSVEYDHPDCFPTYEDMVGAFESFVSLLPHGGTLVACIDDPGAASLMMKARRLGRQVVGYSRQQEATITAPRFMQAREIIRNQDGGFDFQAITNVGATSGAHVSLQVAGEHNVANALAALSVVALLNLSIEDAAAALTEFSGTSRRFEVKGEVDGIVIIDDYAHHPSEVRATLAAARARYPGHRIVAVWQPHTYSRTRALFTEFAAAFDDADEVIVTEIYAAREPIDAFSSETVVQAMHRDSAHFIAGLHHVEPYLLQILHRGDILLVLSAGDADQISTNVLARLKGREQ